MPNWGVGVKAERSRWHVGTVAWQQVGRISKAMDGKEFIDCKRKLDPKTKESSTNISSKSAGIDGPNSQRMDIPTRPSIHCRLIGTALYADCPLSSIQDDLSPISFQKSMATLLIWRRKSCITRETTMSGISYEDCS